MEKAKRAAGYRAADMILDEDRIIGVGTGSTVAFFIEALREKNLMHGRMFLASSLDTALKLREMEARLLDPSTVDHVDVYIDGADEVDAEGNMIKGRGGAHVREKMLAYISRRNIFVVDESKLVGKLGGKPLPIEVLPNAVSHVLKALRSMGLDASIRSSRCKDGPCISDNGGVIIDVRVGVIEDPEGLEARLLRIPGVVDTGLFIGYVDRLVVGMRSGEAVVKEFKRRRGLL